MSSHFAADYLFQQHRFRVSGKVRNRPTPKVCPSSPGINTPRHQQNERLPLPAHCQENLRSQSLRRSKRKLTPCVRRRGRRLRPELSPAPVALPTNCLLRCSRA